MKLLIFSLLGVLFFGCKETPMPQEKKSKKAEEILAKNSNVKKEPKIKESLTIEALGSGSFAKNPNMRSVRRVALLRAKANLSEMIKIHIISEITQKQNCKNEICRQEIKSQSKQISKNLIQKAKITKEWFDEKSQTYYVQLVLDKVL